VFTYVYCEEYGRGFAGALEKELTEKENKE
jgi:hypothetical protein